MMIKILRLWVSSDFASSDDDGSGYTDVIVELTSREKYVSAFYTLKGVEGMIEQFRVKRRNLEGGYFWEKNLVIVKSISKEFIQEVVSDLIDQGDFFEAFRKV